MKARGARLVVEALEAEGARFTFGIPGTHNIELYDALEDSRQITPVLVTDEQSAGFAADGVSRSSDSVGVVNLVPGAGVTHALSGIAEAFLDTVPLVVLSCGIRSDTGRAFQLHAIDQLALLRPVCKAVFAVATADEITPTVRRAFRLARAGAPGPVAVEIPANLYLLTQEIADARIAPPEPGPRAPEPDALERAAALLGAAAYPAIYAGLGARRAGHALVAVAESLDAPVCTTISGKGVFPERHPLFLWNGFGRSAPPFVRAAMDRCDALLAVGCRFGEVATASYGLATPAVLIHVDADATVFDRNFPTKLAIEADAEAFLAALLPRLAARPRNPDQAAAIAGGHRDVAAAQHEPGAKDRLAPAALFDAIAELAPHAIVTADSGNGTFLAMEHLRLDAPGRFLAPVDFSCMGYSVPAALGAKLANPGRDVVALAGDGALLMTGLELLTAAAHHAGVLVCVLHDGELAQIAQFQRTTLNRDTCSVLPPVQLEDLARAAGCRYVPLAPDADPRGPVAEALALARSGIPVMVDAPIDYSRKTWFTKGVVATNFWRLPWPDRVRLAARALGRRLGGA
jgi:acetolactate synthase I/II/III large subunit